jgi:hypothetical protein
MLNLNWEGNPRKPHPYLKLHDSHGYGNSQTTVRINEADDNVRSLGWSAWQFVFPPRSHLLFQNVHLMESGSFLSVSETLLITPILTFEYT